MIRWPSCSVIGIDLETTGINRERDRIIQYGIWGIDKNKNVVSVCHVVDAEVPTGRDPANIPGVTQSMIDNATPLRMGHLQEIHKYCNDAIIVIHNKSHDWEIIKNEFKRNNFIPPHPIMICCTLWMARHKYKLPPPWTLGSLCAYNNVKLNMAHNALYDAKACFELFLVFANNQRMWDLWFRHKMQASQWRLHSKYFIRNEIKYNNMSFVTRLVHKYNNPLQKFNFKVNTRFKI